MSKNIKALISGLFWVLLANLLVKPLWILGIEVGVQNAVGTAAYGFYFGILNLTFIFNILLDFGVTNFNTRNIAQNPQLIRKHLSGILSLKLIFLVVYIAVTFAAGAFMGYSSRHFRLLAWLCVNQFLNSLILFLRSNFEGLLLFKWDSLFSVLDRLIMIVVCGILLWCPLGQGPFRIEWFVYAQTAAYTATALAALTVIARRAGLRRLSFNRLFSLAIVKKSLPFALLVLLMASYNRIDPLMLQMLSPDSSGDFNAGVYAGAFRLLEAITMVAYLVSVPLLPVFSKMTHPKNGDSAEIKTTLRLTVSLMFVFSVTAACVLSSLSGPTMRLFYKVHTDSYAAVFQTLIFCIIPISATYVFGTLLTAAGRLRSLNLFAASSLLTNIIVNLICIPRWGAIGSAWAALGAQSLMAVAQIVASLSLFKIKPSASYILKLTLFALFLVACTFGARHLPWWATLSVATVVATSLAFILKLIDIKEIKRIISTEK